MEVTAHAASVDITGDSDVDRSLLVRDAQEGISETFEREFSCISADDAKLRLHAYKIRYDVYCVERKYEDPEKNVAGLETDEFDSHSPHKLLLHRRSGRFAGVVRLILPLGRDGAHRLSFMRHADENLIAGTAFPASHTAEVSRFAITRQFRDGLRSPPDGSIRNEVRSGSTTLLCHLSIGLMRAVVELAAEHNMTHLCAVMEPALLRLLSRLGVHFQALGPKIDHHGWRQPCFADLDRLLARTWAERRDIWEILTHRGRVWPVSFQRSQSPMCRALIPE